MFPALVVSEWLYLKFNCVVHTPQTATSQLGVSTRLDGPSAVRRSHWLVELDLKMVTIGHIIYDQGMYALSATPCKYIASAHFISQCRPTDWQSFFWCAILIAHQIVMAKHGGSCVHFSGISTCGRTSRETVSHSQRQPLPTPHKIALPVTNKRLQPLTTTLYNSLVLSFSLLTTKRRLIKHRSFLRVLRSS